MSMSVKFFSILLPFIAIGIFFYQKDFSIEKLEYGNIVKTIEKVYKNKEVYLNEIKLNINKYFNYKTDLNQFENNSNDKKTCDLGQDKLFSKKQLAQFNGSKRKIYLALLGIVYDVSKGEKHYGEGSSYSIFIGKDATRAFITGDFSENGLTDDLTGIPEESFSSVKEWIDFYQKQYKRVGRVIGYFYDKKGCPTNELNKILTSIKSPKEEDLQEKYDEQIFPHCNSEWNNKNKETRYWCTDLSGGFKREWVGVPRKLFKISNNKEFRCACVKDYGPETDTNVIYDDEVDKKNLNNGDLSNSRVKEFENCKPKSYECFVQDA